MPTRRTGIYNTPQIRNGGFGALQVEALTNRPLSIARRHLAASQLRMRDIEPDELSSSDWVRFLVMEERERERWMTEFRRRRRNSDESTSSAELDRDTAHLKAEEARQEAREEGERSGSPGNSSGMPRPVQATPSRSTTGRTPAVSIWARYFDEDEEAGSIATARASIPHHQRAVTTRVVEAPPAYHSIVRARTPPPAYEPPLEGVLSPRYEREDPNSPRLF